MEYYITYLHVEYVSVDIKKAKLWKGKKSAAESKIFKMWTSLINKGYLEN